MHMVRFQCEHKQDKTIHRIEVCEKYKLSTTLHLLKKKIVHLKICVMNKYDECSGAVAASLLLLLVAMEVFAILLFVQLSLNVCFM